MCPDGMVFHEGECQPPKVCGCTDDEGKHREVCSISQILRWFNEGLMFRMKRHGYQRIALRTTLASSVQTARTHLEKSSPSSTNVPHI